jgi:ATP-binding protein involved in chromosome partitioning
VTLREGGDAGMPLVLGHPESAVAQQLTEIASGLAARSRGLAGRRLGLSPV